MASFIQELENNEALLLMYFTDELPVDDRAEVEQMLASDAGMRAALAEIASAYSASMGVLNRLDADRSAEPAENHAVRQASRAMKQWQVDRLNRQPVMLPAPRSGFPLWTYPVGVAAMLLIGMIVWFVHQNNSQVASIGNVAGNNTPAVISLSPAEAQAKASLLENSFAPEVPAGISDAESQASSLVARSDDNSMTSSIFLSEGNQ